MICLTIKSGPVHKTLGCEHAFKWKPGWGGNVHGALLRVGNGKCKTLREGQTARPLKLDENFARLVDFEGPFTTPIVCDATRGGFNFQSVDKIVFL